jgi:phosphoglycolate phosphatase
MRYSLLAFDWDGTLHDSVVRIATSVRGAAADLGLPVPSEADARHIIGLGLADAMRHLFPDLAPRDYPALVERYRARFMAGEASSALFDGAADALAALEARGHLLAVATGKSRVGLDHVLRVTGLERRFHATRCADEGHPKPNPDMLFALMRVTGVDPHEVLMIGDTTHDIDMAHAAGVDALAVGYGAHPANTLTAARPRALVASPREAWAWLQANG